VQFGFGANLGKKLLAWQRIEPLTLYPSYLHIYFLTFLSTPCDTDIIVKAHLVVVFFGRRYPSGSQTRAAGIEIQLLAFSIPAITILFMKISEM